MSEAYDNHTPITRQELLDKYGVVPVNKESQSWSREIVFVGSDSIPHRCVLYWDTWDGYEIVWQGVPPKDLLDLADRPEFEYIVDAITEGHVDG